MVTNAGPAAPLALEARPDAGGLRDALASFDPRARAARGWIVVVQAPGRVNLIGEHTDYNEGLVLPAAIDRGITIALLPLESRSVELVLAATGERAMIDLESVEGGEPRPTGTWVDYVAGTAWALAEAGLPTSGFVGILASDLPMSAGLSSSAALELASAWALTAGTGGGVDGLALARICQRAESEYVGARVGIMDQVASSLGVAGGALLLDCRSLEVRAVPLPLAEHAIVVCHSGSPRRLLASEYNLRRAQCEAVVAILAASDPSIRSLRDVTPDMLDEVRATVDDVGFRRCRHVVLENERVRDTVAALQAGDLETVGRLFAGSHASLRDDYEVSSPELDALVEIASGTRGVVGARLTGAGFGGCTVNLVRRDAVPDLRAAIERDYPARTGLRPWVLEVEPAAGAGRIDG